MDIVFMIFGSGCDGGMDEMQEPLFTTVKLEEFVPADHPLRPIRLLVSNAISS
ncbi:hypothetical protein [Paraburkholderia sp. BR14320]|uniref:hypothetical protein n=1 Tax=unclassified Paraburkholderia TaxID=2615204 RepID=UPI0034CD658A